MPATAQGMIEQVGHFACKQRGGIGVAALDVFRADDRLGGFLSHFLGDLVYAFAEEVGGVRAFGHVALTLRDHRRNFFEYMGI